MLEIIIRLEEQERVFKALNVNSSEDVKEEFVNYLNSRVNDYEQSIEMQKVIEAYAFVPLTEVVEDPPDEDHPVEDPIEEPTDEDPVEDPVEEPDEPPVEDLEEQE